MGATLKIILLRKNTMTTIEILNLKCGGCANTITKGLNSIEGVNEVSVDVESSTVKVDTSDTNLLVKIKEKLSSMGYPEVESDNTVLHKTKSFISCASGRMSK